MKTTAQSFKKLAQGFTLIELLVVIAVIGVLAGAIIVAINPTEQLERGRDSGRISSSQQLADAVNGYYAANGGTLPLVNATWINTLTSSGDLKVQPATPAGTNCTATGLASMQNGFCYVTGGSTTNFAVFVRLQSVAQTNKCGGGTTQAYYLYSSSDAKAGTVCGTGAGGTTQPNTAGGYTYF